MNDAAATMANQAAIRFMKANDKSLVVAGRAIGDGGEGAVYTLENGQRHSLDLAASRALADDYPKWKLP